MIVADLPPLIAAPAVIMAREAAVLRLHVNDGRMRDAGHDLPADFLSMPAVLRATVAPSELRGFLPEPYRLLSDALIVSLLGGLPGPMMAGGIKAAWLLTASGSLQIPSDWNRNDNAFHAVGRGGNGTNALFSSFSGICYSGGGGGGAAYAGLRNIIRAVDEIISAVIATTSGDTHLTDNTLVAKSGSNAGAVSGGSSNGGSGGSAASSVGSIKSNGGNGRSADDNTPGGNGGGCGGPHGDGLPGANINSTGSGDAGYGGNGNGWLPSGVSRDGIYGPAGGWNPRSSPNAGSGGGGAGGIGRDLEFRNGLPGGLYGAGSGGGYGNVSPTVTGSGAPGTQGCMLIVNNASL